MEDPNELVLVYKALALARGANGYVTGYVEWCNDYEAENSRRKLSDHGLTPEGIKWEVIDFVAAGGRVEQKQETREGFDYPYYYKVVLPIDGIPGGVFVEMRLVDEDADDPVVYIVSAHRQGV